MIKNYYLFKKQIEQIRPQLLEAEVVSIFTTNKDELIFELLKDTSSFLLKVSISAQAPYILIDRASKQKGDRLSFFENLSGEALTDIKVAIYNKYVIIEFGPFSLYVWFYGAKPNIVLFDEKKNPIESFKTLTSITEVPNEIPIPLSQNLLANAIKTSPQLNISKLISALCPAFNRNMVKELCHRLGKKIDSEVGELKDIKGVFDIFTRFLKEIESGICYIFSSDDGEKKLTLYESQILTENGFSKEKFTDINKAWLIFVQNREREKAYHHLYKKISSTLHKKRKTLETALVKIADAENIEERKRIADLKGNLLLTNKHKVPRGSASVELVNIFSDKQELVKIKLNPKKKTVENANHYFSKYKQIAEKKQVIKLKKATYQKELEEINLMQQKLGAAKIKELLKLKEKLVQMNILQEHQAKKAVGSDLQYAFRRLILENRWDIYIGKNGVNNDLLTFSFANKWDIWMHAQGVPGSHVIIKVRGKDVSVPLSIIEEAAQIAAANSRAKHSATVPVIYTQCRHVSRIRKALPGTVTVRNEKVIFVKPLLLNF